MSRQTDVIRNARRAQLRLEAEMPILVVQARATGASWADIGDALGITRQAAWERFATTRERDKGYREIPGQTALDHA